MLFSVQFATAIILFLFMINVILFLFYVVMKFLILMTCTACVYAILNSLQPKIANIPSTLNPFHW